MNAKQCYKVKFFPILALTRIMLRLAYMFLQMLDRNMGFPQILTPKFWL